MMILSGINIKTGIAAGFLSIFIIVEGSVFIR